MDAKCKDFRHLQELVGHRTERRRDNGRMRACLHRIVITARRCTTAECVAVVVIAVAALAVLVEAVRWMATP